MARYPISLMKLGVNLGGRHFDYDRVDTITYPECIAFKGVDAKKILARKVKLTKPILSFTPNEDALIYAQWSEGFRLGKGQGFRLHQSVMSMMTVSLMILRLSNQSSRS